MPRKRSPTKASAPVNGKATDWIAQHSAQPEEVRSFCRQHDLFAAGRSAVTAAQKQLGSREIRVGIEADPEGTGEWLVVDVDLQGEVQTVLEEYHRLKDAWRAHLSSKERDLMRLVYNIV